MEKLHIIPYSVGDLPEKSSNFSSLGLRERAPTSLFLGTYKVVPHS